MADKKNIQNPTLKMPKATSADPIQAYLDATAASNIKRSQWDIIGDSLSDLSTGIQTTNLAIQEEKRIKQEERKAELEKYELEFENNVNKITENAGSLGEEYFTVATEEAKKMQLEYANAVKTGDKELQQKLKMRLNALSVSTQSMKQILSDCAEIKNSDDFSNGMTKEQKQILAVCTSPSNATFQDGEWMFRNPEHDPSNPKSKEFFTQDDLDKAIVTKDFETANLYNKFEFSMIDAGAGFVNGTSTANFDYSRIKAKIEDQFVNEDNIMSIMHDDFRAEGSGKNFLSEVSTFMDQTPDFYKAMNIDVNMDGKVNEGDWDSDADKEVLIRAIVDKTSPHYNFQTSKSIVADYLTSKSQQSFYGNANPDLPPNADESLDSFIKRGGVAGLWFNRPGSGFTFDEETQTFIKGGDIKEDLDKLDLS